MSKAPCQKLSCPACRKEDEIEAFSLVESHLDPVDKKAYRILRCLACGVIFSEPRIPPDSDWYARAFSYGIIERHHEDESDWRFQRFLEQKLPSSAFIIDVGCGEGEFLRVANKFGYRAKGFDFDPDGISKARASGLDAECVDFSKSFENGDIGDKAEIVTLFDVLEHVPEPADFIAKVKRLIKPRGYLALTLPDDRCPYPWGQLALNYPPNHFTRWSPRSLTGILERQGFEVIHIESERLVPRFLSGQFFFNFLMPRLLPLVKRILFGARAASTKSISELYAASKKNGRGERASGRDRQKRQKLIDAACTLFGLLTYPVARAAIVRYEWKHARCGDNVRLGQTLFALAQRKSERDSPLATD